jgi:translation elongation factor P/translation initiation factor 5A
MIPKKLGKSGIVYRRGQQVVLRNTKTDKKVAVKVIMYDSMQGWLAENGEGEWIWYREENENWPNEKNYWVYVKEAGT